MPPTWRSPPSTRSWLSLRDRAGDARTDANARLEDRRARLNKLQEEIPAQVGELRERLTTEELRKAAEGYADAAQTTYAKLVERGEAALERLRSQPALEDAANRVEGITDQAVELTQEALGNVATQTRAVGERAAKLVGVELPKRTESASEPVKKAAVKAPAPTPAKKTPRRLPPRRPRPRRPRPRRLRPRRSHRSNSTHGWRPLRVVR